MTLFRILEREKKRMGLYKSNLIENPIFDNFESNPGYRVVNHIKNGDSKDVGVHILDSGDTDNIPRRYIIPKPPYEFRGGDVVSFGKDDIWLCTTVNTSLYNKGYFQKTNTHLNWINEQDKLISKPALVTTKTLYTTGVKDESRILVPNGMMGMLLSKDNDSSKLKRGDHFVYNNVRYRVTFCDFVTISGVVSLICEEVGLEKGVDDPINNIANRYREDGSDRLNGSLENPNYPEPESPQVVEVVISGDSVIGFGKSKDYSVNVDVPIEVVDKEGLVHSVEENNGIYTITSKKQYIGGVIELVVVYEDETYKKIVRIGW